jgi:O-antigen ligase
VSRSLPCITRRVEAVRPGARGAGRVSGAWSRTDALLLLLSAVGAVWSFISATVSGGDPAPVALLFLVVGLVFALSRIATEVNASIVPIAVVAAALIVIASADDPFSRFPLSGPFGYTNATGAFFAQAAIAAVMLATIWRRGWTKIAAAAVAIGFAAVPFVIDSRTPALLLLTLPFIALIIRELKGPRAAVLGCAVLFLITLLVTGTLAATHDADDPPGLVDRVIGETLTERRVALWHEALVLMGQHPASGVGPGRFAVVNPLAQANRDVTLWAHQGFLQQGAEEGVPGLIILVLLFVYGFARLTGISTLNPAAVPGAVALAVLGIDASLDYVLHFAAIPITAAALVGAATGRTTKRSGQT